MSKIIFLLFLFAGFAFGDPRPSIPNTFRTNQKIQYDQYPYEQFWVTTSDGYILNLHHIINPGKAPVMLAHGMSSQSSSWVMSPSKIMPGDANEKNLAYLLFNAGFDVWMPDFRGNTYSTNHTTLDPASGQKLLSGFYEFWDFSFEEIATKDLPAIIDFILEKTDHDKLSYVGMSLGTTDVITLQALNPSYAQSKINYAVLLAPVAYLNHLTSPLFRGLATLILPGVTELILRDLGPGQFTPQGSVNTAEILSQICSTAALNVSSNICLITPEICAIYMFSLYGVEYDQLDCNNIPIYMVQTDKSSTKTMLHLAQGINHEGFTKYDYGAVNNLVYYGTLKPPSYNLSNVKIPMRMYWGSTDALADPTDVQHLYDKIKGNYVNQEDIKLIKVDHELFNHADFIWAKDVVQLLYNDVIANLISRNQ